MNQRTCFKASLRTFALALLLAVPAAAPAQTPAAFPQLDVATTPSTQLLTGIALDGQGSLTLVGTQLASAGESALGRRFSAADVPLGPDFVLAPVPSSSGEAAANMSGATVLSWSRPRPGGGTDVVVRRISPTLGTGNFVANGPGAVRRGPGDVAISRSGNFVAVWDADNAIFGQRFNADGTKRGPELRAAPISSRLLGGAKVAMNPTNGELVVVWVARDSASGAFLGIFGQRFGFFVGRLGGEFQVNTSALGPANTAAVDIGRAADGSFVVAWSRRREGELVLDVYAQRFGNDGAKLGGEIVIADAAPVSDGFVRLAVAPQGQFVAAWDDGAPPLFVRLFRKDGTPAGPARELVKGTAPFPGAPELAFGFNGTFVLGWTDFIGIHEPDDDEWEINYQRFAASPGSEICVFRNGRFRCDTNGGGAPEVDHVFAVRGGVPLLGDVDDDGRDDYCLFRGTRFDCDSGHDYHEAEFTLFFGQPGDTPLLGDVNGDGRDEACVFRTDRFLCDTAHDGGAAETVIVFGQAGDRALLGDLNGDGRDDACVFRAGQFQCDTAGNGGAAETVIAFFLPGNGVPLLGDIDDDGRADPCFFGTGAFRCDTRHDGAVAETVVAVTGVGRPLIGNVDGL
ncbi:MAG TPA: hypothetical protein VKK31_00835 [Thermoanaerobaculia bacterium]|nr:hypothetical protein [Thermoanaerobaculia bacterium]